MAHRRDYAVTAPDLRAVTHDEPMFSGALSFCRRAYVRDLAGVDVAVMGIPFDLAVTNRPGARLGPRAIRAASVNLAWSRPWPWAKDPFATLAVADWGDAALTPSDPAGVPAEIEAAIAHVIGAAGAALILGGDHFVSYPSLCAHAAKHAAPLALIQFDAHCDTWAGGGIDHGTMFRRAIEEGLVDPARSIQIGARTTNDAPGGVTIRDAVWCHEMGPAAIAAEIRRVVGDAPCYLTFDIDALDPSCAPGTGTPVVGGLFSWQALAALRGLAGIALVGMAVVEVSPPYDVAEITALAGATVALDLLCVYAAKR